jgi:L-ascorbate metabolism protein UlaG (beta-lactamase superfamily)
MNRFHERATQPRRGPSDIFRWKVLRVKDGPKRPDFDALDRVRPGVVEGGGRVLGGREPVAVWIGHATWAVRLGGQLVVTDPIWSRAISGVVPRLVEPGVPFGELPRVDVVLVTHDHRDHMDLPTLERLGPAPLYVVPLGNAERLRKLGLPRVVELDWWQTHEHESLSVTLVPARHWSMREPWNRNDTLWGGFVVRSPEGSFYHSGDTAYGDHFAEIGARLGPVDWAMLPIGAYAPRWFMEPQHMDPREAVRACVDLGARHLLAMHWGTFRLTDEAIGEPPERLRAHWDEQGLGRDGLWIADVGQTLPLGR